MARFEVSTVMKDQDKTPCNDMVGYHCFGGPCCLHFQDGVSELVSL